VERKETVEEAGMRGGLKTSGDKWTRIYSEIGGKGGKIGWPKGEQRIRKLIEDGKAHEEE